MAATAVCVAGVALGDIGLTLRGRGGTGRHRPSACVTGMALGDIDVYCAWQAWHLATSAFISHGRRQRWHLVTHQPTLYVVGVALMALGWLWWRSWVPVDAVDAAAVCVAGVALGDIDVALMALDRLWLQSQLTPWTLRLFVWQGWHLATGLLFVWQVWHWATSMCICVAGVALMVARLGPS